MGAESSSNTTTIITPEPAQPTQTEPAPTKTETPETTTTEEAESISDDELEGNIANNSN